MYIHPRRRGSHHWMLGLLVGAALIYAVYTLLISPFAGRWRGIFGASSVPEGYSIRGIDVSHHQGKIDWQALSRAKIGSEPVTFAFIKATEGTGMVDRRFFENFAGASDAGLVRGAYHYYQPDSDARRQALNFIRHVPLRSGDLPPVLDIETTGKQTPEALRENVLRWLRAVERHYGCKPILYTYYNFRQRYLATPEFDEYPYWIAHYYVDTLAYTGTWKFWQHTDRGRVNGIKGEVDLDAYNGSMYDLRRLMVK